MKILFLNSEYNGVAYWRMFEPARWMNMSYKDIHVTYFPHDERLDFHKPLSEWERLAKSHDLIVSGRVSEPQSITTMLFMREVAQKPIVMEMDDDWSCVEKTNLAYKDWHPNSVAVKMAKAQVEYADLLQVSTHPLKQSMGYRFGKETFIQPNLIDIEKWAVAKHNAKKEKRDHLRIGWAGSATHYGDFLEILPALKEIGKKYQNAQFVFCGMRADYFVGDNSFIDKDRIEYNDGCQFWGWHNKVASLDLDIVIVPVADNKFNKSKSNCRYLEFSSIGVPGVYSAVYPYSNTITNGENGFVARSHMQWVDSLSSLIESEELRKHMGEMAHKNVEENYSFQNKIDIWKDNYEKMAGRVSSMKFVPYYPGDECQTQ